MRTQRDRPRMLNVVYEFTLERLCNRNGREFGSADRTKLPCCQNQNRNNIKWLRWETHLN